MQDNLLKKIMKNSSIIFFGDSLGSVLGLITFTIMARQLGPEFLAILVLSQTYSLILNDIFNIQTWESMIKFGSGTLKSEDILDVIKSNFLLDLASAIIAFVFALLLVKPISILFAWDESYRPIISLYSVSILFNITTFTIGIPRLFNKFYGVAKIRVLSALFRFLGILMMMVYFNKLEGYIFVYLVVDIFYNLSLIIFSLTLLRAKYGGDFWKGPLKMDREQMRFIWWTNLRSIIRIPVRHFDMVVISSLLSLELLGVYKVYKEIADVINRIGEPINQAIFPEFTKLLGSKDIKKTNIVAKKTISLLAGVSFVLVLLMLVSSKFLIGVFFGAEYIAQINVLYMLIVIVGLSLTLVPINSLFIAAGFVKYSVVIVVFTNSIYLIAIFALTELIGLYGIVFAFALQMLLNQGLKFFFLRKYSSDWGVVIR